MSRHYAASFKGAVEIDWSDAQARRALVGQLVADARVALQVAGRALQGYAKEAPETQELRTAQQLLQDLLAQDIDEEPEDGGDPQIRRGTTGSAVRRCGTDASNTQRFDGHKATVVVDTDDQVVLATDVRAGNVSGALVAEPQRPGTGGSARRYGVRGSCDPCCD